jgi:serine/threonine protein kinase/uncharacterized protein (DUF2141 family)
MRRACPSVDDYQQLSLGLLPESVAAELEQHLLECPSCIETVRRVATDPRLVAALHAQAEPTPLAERKQIDTLIGRMLAHDFSAHEATSTKNGPAVLTPPDVTQELYGSLAPAQQADEIGRLGPYRVLKVLGIGGMGVVFLAEDPQLRRLVALKTMRLSLAANPEARQRFLREAQAAAALSHDHIVTIHQVGQDRDVPYLAMQLLQGETLEDRLNRRGKLPIAEVLRVGREIAEGLGAAHECGLVHRDIKPGNIWLEAERDRVKILDFGLAKSGDALEIARAKASSPEADTPLVSLSPVLTHTGTLLGTPAYMAPEQALGLSVDQRSDLFSLGCVLYRMCTGVVPFKGRDINETLRALTKDNPRPPRQLNPAVPPTLSALVMKLLAKRREDRPAAARAVVEVLAAIRFGSATDGALVRRRRLRIALAAGLALFAVGLASYLFRGRHATPDERTEERVPADSSVETAPPGLFAAAVHYPAGLYPCDVAAGDFNGDGKLDLDVANMQSHTVSVLLGNGDGTFQKAIVSPVGKWFASAVTAADVNGDGKLDLVVVDRGSHQVSVLLGKGDGTFQTPRQYDVGRSPGAVAVADINGDGKLDLVVPNVGSQDVSVLLGKGDGTFQPAVSVPVGKDCYFVAVSDFNRDGKLDLVVAHGPSDTVSVLFGNGDGSFQQPVSYPLGVRMMARALAVADLNGDGQPDLAVVNSGGTAVVLLGKADGTFHPAAHYPAHPPPASLVPEPYFLVIGDFNGDGKLDLALCNYQSAEVCLLLGKGDGTFQAGQWYPVGSSPGSLAAGDFNGDGALDLAVTSYNGNKVSVLLNRSSAAARSIFGPAVHYPAGTFPRALAVADFNHDGRPDLAVVNGTADTVSVLLGGPDATVATAVPYATGKDPVHLAIGDLNRDGQLDVVAANRASHTVSVLLGHRGGTLRNAVSFPTGKGPVCVALADFNRDGRLDLVTADSEANIVSVHLGNGDGTFRKPVAYAAGERPSFVAVGDFNGDGKLDLAVSNRLHLGTVQVLLGNGDGTFRAAVPYNTGSFSVAVAVGDFNGDGKLDLAVANYNSSDVNVLLGNGDGTFQAAANYGAGQGPFAIAAVDVNGDGKLDLAVANSHDNSVSILLGDGRGGFAKAEAYHVGSSPLGVAAGHFHGRARPDLVVANAHSNAVTVLRNRPAAPHCRIAADHLTLAGRPLRIRVWTEDAAHQPDPAFAGKFRFSSSDSQAQLPGDYKLVAADLGSRTFDVTLPTPGVQTITVRDTLGRLIADTVTVRVIGPADMHLRVSAPESVATGTPLSIEATVVDPFNKNVPGYTGTVRFTCTDAAATLPKDYTFNDREGGEHRFKNGVTLRTAGKQTITVTDTVQGTIVAKVTVNVVP